MKVFPVPPGVSREQVLLQLKLSVKGLATGEWGLATVNHGRISFEILLKTYARSLQIS